MNGLNGFVYRINGEIKPDGSIVGVARVGQGGLYFAGAMTPTGLQMMFAEPDANGQPNQKTAKTVVFTAGKAPKQNAGLPPNSNRPQTMQPQKPDKNRQFGFANLEQCNKAHNDCMARCKGGWDCIKKNCDPINEKCIVINNSSKRKSGPDRDVEGIIKDSEQRTLDNMYDRWRIQDGYR